MNTPAAVQAQWTDTHKNEYAVYLAPESIRFEGAGATTDLPKERWPMDLYVARYGAGYLVRVETFAKSLQFVLSESQAAPLIELLTAAAQQAAMQAAPADSPDDNRQPALLWPKVSPLAVWALICSSLSFVPIFGWLPALATVVLLIFHRIKVRRVPATSHSRAMCGAAFVFLIAGCTVSLLATWIVRQHGMADLESTSFLTAPRGSEKHWGMIISGIVVVLLSLSVHECAHAITAWWLGDGLARSLGRVTLNPLAHIDPIGTVLLPLILAISKAPIFFGYAKPVPVYVDSLPRYRRAHILISVAGPGSNLLMAAGSLLLLLGGASALRTMMPEATVTNLASLSLSVPVEASGFPLASYFGLACTLLKLSFVINVVLAFFNLIPIPPLDGSWVLEHLFPRTLGPFYAMIRPYGFLIFVLALYGNVFDYLRLPIDVVLGLGLALVSATTGW